MATEAFFPTAPRHLLAAHAALPIGLFEAIYADRESFGSLALLAPRQPQFLSFRICNGEGPSRPGCSMIQLFHQNP